MQSTQVEGLQQRKVGPFLGIGIAVLPLLFGWFLLRPGHSVLARVVGFTWAAFVLWVLMGGPADPPSASGVTFASQPKTASEPVPEPDGDAKAGKITRRAKLSPAAKRLQSLYAELEGFRHEPDFVRIGFMECCRYFGWKERVEELDRTSGAALFREHGIVPRDLVQLGLEYALNGGRTTSVSETIAARLDYALTPANPAAGGGRATDEGWWCRDIETSFASLQALEEGDFARSEALRDEAACPHVLQNTATGPELERRFYKFSDGGTLAFAKVRLSDGVEVWAPLDAIEFR